MELKKWDWQSLILPAVAIAPLLYLQCVFLWEKQHLQFFPLAFVAATWFFLAEGKLSSNLSTNRRTVAIIGSFVATAICCGSLIVVSAWLAHFTLVLLVCFWALGRFGNLTILRIVGICGLIAITVPAPMGLDKKLVQSLQSVSTRICSDVMDVLQIVHCRKGNIIEIASKPLFVEEACSGVDSQYALMAIAGVLLLAGRTGFVVSLVTIMTVPIWAILGNILRILSIVVGLDSLQMDLSGGVAHTLLGMIVFAITAFCHWSSVQFLNYLEFYFPRGVSRACDPLFPKNETVIDRCGIADTHPRFRSLLLLLLFSLSPTGILTVVSYHSTDLPKIDRDLVSRFPNELDLPASIENQFRNHFHIETRSRRDFNGQYSLVWNYSGAETPQIVSFDLPFRGWHPLWGCYVSAGWQLIHTSVVSTSSDGKDLAFPFYEVSLRNGEGEFAILHFSLFDEYGHPFEDDGSFVVNSATTSDYFLHRVFLSVFRFFSQKDSRGIPLTFQIQSFSVIGRSPVSPEQLKRIRNVYEISRRRIYEKSLPVVLETWKK